MQYEQSVGRPLLSIFPATMQIKKLHVHYA